MEFTLLDSLPVDWAAWTLQNVIRGVAIADIQSALRLAGYDESARELGGRAGFNASEAAACTVRSLIVYRTALLRRMYLRKQRNQPVERRELDPSLFYSSYYFANEPVILAPLPTLEKLRLDWTFDYLSRRFGDILIEAQRGREGDPDYEINFDKHREKMRLDGLIKLIEDSGPNNDIYMCANNRALDSELSRMFGEIPDIDDLLEPKHARGKTFLWMGPQGTITPFHYDLMNVLLYQVHGRKSFVLAPPEATPFMYNDVSVYSRVNYFGDRSQFPLFEGVPLKTGILHPGEALFIPVGWWHAIRAESKSISLSFTNFLDANEYRKVT